MPFTRPHKHGMFFRFGPQAVARDGDVGILTDADGGGIGVGSTTMFEVLEVFGKPKIKNCMYGTYQWSSPFRLVQSYTSADISGQPDLDVQSRSSMENVYMSADGKYIFFLDMAILSISLISLLDSAFINKIFLSIA